MKIYNKLAAVLIVLLMTAGCARSPQERCARFLASGKKYLEKKDYSRAALEFRSAAQADPRNAGPHYQLALVYLENKDVRSAAAALKKTTELDPKHKDAQLKLAQLMAATTNKELVEEAEKRVREVYAGSPGDADVLSTLAAVEWRLGKLDDAEAHLNQVFQKSPENLRSSMMLARLKLAQKDVEGAEGVLKKLVAASPGKPEPLIALGAFYAVRGRAPEAEPQFRQALQVDPKNGLAMVSLAGLKLRSGAAEEAEQLYKRASELADPLYKPVYGLYLFQTSRQDRAIVEFEKLAKAEPGNREARNRLVNAYLSTKRVAEAETILREALKKNPKDLDAALHISQIHLRKGEYAEAESRLTDFLKLEPNSGMAHYLMSNVYQQRGSILRQRQELTEAVRLAPNLVAARIELARVLTMTNAAKAALDLLDGTPEPQRNLLAVVVQRNWALLALGNSAEAAKGIQRALEVGKRPDVLLQQAILKMNQRDNAGARQSLEEALKLNPEDINALNMLVQIYMSQNQKAEALQRVREQVKQRPNSARLQLYLGERLQIAGDLAGARQAYAAAKTASPGFPLTDLALGQLDLAEGKLEDARRNLSGLISRNPSDIRARLLLAALEEKASQYVEAVEQYRKVVELDERNVVALNNLAFLLAEHTQMPDEALKYAEKAQEFAPDSAVTLDTLGWAYYRKGIYTRAIQYLEQANSKEPSGLRNSHLGAAYIRSGDRKRGMALIESAMAKDPKLQQSKSFQNIMREIR